MRIIAYSLMRTHFHLFLWPFGDGDLVTFMHRLTTTHAMRWHRARGSVGTGAVYQSRYVSVGIEDGRHYFTALRYVERNALEANLVRRAEDWHWCSAWQIASEEPTFVLDDGPYPRPANWLDLLNGDQQPDDKVEQGQPINDSGSDPQRPRGRAIRGQTP
jgi:putative transposase